MVFVTVDEDRVRLNHMTELLVRTFPGSVIYQYSDPIHAVIHMENRQIDAVFANAGVFQRNDWNLLALMRRNQPKLQVFILSDDEALRETAMERGAREYLVRPVTGQELRNAIQVTIQERETLHPVKIAIST